MRRIALLAASLTLSSALPAPAAAQEAKATEPGRPGPDVSREIAALGREIGKLRTEVTALRKQVEEMKKADDEMRPQMNMLLRHRHQLFLDFLRADAFFPQAKGTFFVTTPSPDTLTKTSGPVAGPQ